MVNLLDGTVCYLGMNLGLDNEMRICWKFEPVEFGLCHSQIVFISWYRKLGFIDHRVKNDRTFFCKIGHMFC